MLDSRVSQGSILGPLLFVIYTSYFPSALKYCKAQFYTDDSQIYYSLTQVEQELAFERINHLEGMLLCLSATLFV